MSMSPVTGRGTLGPLPDEYDGFYGTISTPVFGGYESLPLNYEAEREIYAAENSEFEALRQIVAKKKNVLKLKCLHLLKNFCMACYFLSTCLFLYMHNILLVLAWIIN